MNHMAIYETRNKDARRYAFAALPETCPQVKALFDDLRSGIRDAIYDADSDYDAVCMVNDLLLFAMGELIEDVTSKLRLAQIDAYEQLLAAGVNPRCGTKDDDPFVSIHGDEAREWRDSVSPLDDDDYPFETPRHLRREAA